MARQLPGHFCISVMWSYSLHFRQRLASGYASKRFGGIFALQFEQLPYVPFLMRTSASFMARTRNSYECSTGNRAKYSVTSSASSSRLTFGSSRLYSGNLLSQSPFKLGSFFAKVSSEASRSAFVFSSLSLNFLRLLLVINFIIAIKKRAANRGWQLGKTGFPKICVRDSNKMRP